MFSRNFLRNFSLILQQFVAQLSEFLMQRFFTLLMWLKFLQVWSHLLNLSRLSCLCITCQCSSYPAVSVGKINTSRYQSRLTDVILPGQSYLCNVHNSITWKSDNQSLQTLSLLGQMLAYSSLLPIMTPIMHLR